jgi:hypothetical protein
MWCRHGIGSKLWVVPAPLVKCKPCVKVQININLQVFKGGQNSTMDPSEVRESGTLGLWGCFQICTRMKKWVTIVPCHMKRDK